MFVFSESIEFIYNFICYFIHYILRCINPDENYLKTIFSENLYLPQKNDFFSGVAYRKCLTNGAWDIPNFDSCTDRVYTQILDEVGRYISKHLVNLFNTVLGEIRGNFFLLISLLRGTPF